MAADASRMETEPVRRVLLSIGIPILCSLVTQALYNIVDSAFVSNMPADGEAGLTALTLAFPIQMLIISVGIGTGAGVNALLSKNLGARNRQKVIQIFGHANFLGIVIYILFMLFGIFGTRAYIASQTSDPLIRQMGVQYLSICTIVSFGVVFFPLYEKILQSTGRSKLSTAAQITGALTNIVLDPIMIYGLFGVPAFGVAGAAYATVISQILTFVLAFIFHISKNKEVPNDFSYMLHPSPRLIKEIYAIGLPAIIAQALISVMTYGMNIILGRVDVSAVTAYGLYYKIQQFVLFAAFGIRDAITPIISFNHGARHKERINEGIRYGLIYTVIIMAVGLILLEIFALPLAGLFGLSGQTEGICVSAIRIISLSFIFAGVNIAFQGVYQALDGGMESLIVSLFRQFIFVLPIAYIFTVITGEELDKIGVVWITFIIAEGLSTLIAIGLMKRIRKREIDPLPDEYTDKNREKMNKFA